MFPSSLLTPFLSLQHSDSSPLFFFYRLGWLLDSSSSFISPCLPFSSDNEYGSSIQVLSINLSVSPDVFLPSFYPFSMLVIPCSNTTNAFPLSSSSSLSLQAMTHPRISCVIFSSSCSGVIVGAVLLAHLYLMWKFLILCKSSRCYTSKPREQK